MSQERKVISVPTSPELKADLDLLADDDHRSTASYVRLVLERHVKEQRDARPEFFASLAETVAARS